MLVIQDGRRIEKQKKVLVYVYSRERVEPMRPFPIIVAKGALEDSPEAPSEVNPRFVSHSCLRAHLVAPLEAIKHTAERSDATESFVSHAVAGIAKLNRANTRTRPLLITQTLAGTFQSTRYLDIMLW